MGEETILFRELKLVDEREFQDVCIVYDVLKYCPAFRRGHVKMATDT